MISFEKVNTLKGEIVVPSDKSISHRAFILSAMAEGKSKVLNPLLSRDTLATKAALAAVGAKFIEIDNGFVIESEGFKRFKEPNDIINCENSGTTARLLTGLFSGQNKYFVLTGDNSLRKRPMGRVIEPLGKLGAYIVARENNRFLPLTIIPRQLKGADIVGKVKSAQVKSAIILAGLQADSKTIYTEQAVTRNHTELMLKSYGVDLKIDGLKIEINPVDRLKPCEISVPGDFSSAAFFLGAALMFENAEILIKNVGLNSTRCGMLDILKGMGVNFEVNLKSDIGDPFGDIFIQHQEFEGIKIDGDIVANIIDEIPMISALGLFAKSPVEIRGAEELRVKESDRIKAMVYNLREIGAELEEFDDGLKVYPLKEINKKANLKSFDDHRIAMINILLSKRFGQLSIDEIDAIDVSFPDFISKVDSLSIK
ncbi:MAG: 3-phosphoshikimate 1-carboxyvinyltransferase [Deferribacteraceae bacterium]|jgi:3-phosphoshikimate 1-carboxyvinyltransferase|nr:3-phosphoshikimate 1-carboxyvinyltransferase [Deferribacteraceae bacterium]